MKNKTPWTIVRGIILIKSTQSFSFDRLLQIRLLILSLNIITLPMNITSEFLFKIGQSAHISNQHEFTYRLVYKLCFINILLAPLIVNSPLYYLTIHRHQFYFILSALFSTYFNMGRRSKGSYSIVH